MSLCDGNHYERFDFTGQVAIITGGGRGTGCAFAQAFAEAGAKVVIVARTREQLEETVEFTRSSGGQAIAIPGDVSNPVAAN